MALAKKCDRCGKLYENYLSGLTDEAIKFDVLTTTRTFGKNMNEYAAVERLELCKECRDSLHSWLCYHEK